MNWLNVRYQLPPIWKCVYVKAHLHEEASYLAYRTIWGSWRFKSGIRLKIMQSNLWSYRNK